MSLRSSKKNNSASSPKVSNGTPEHKEPASLSNGNSPSDSDPASPNESEASRRRREVFKRRNSAMDSHANSDFAHNEYRGWFNLFAICLTVFTVFAQFNNILSKGSLINLRSIYDMFLARSDMFPAWLSLCAASFISPTFEMMIARKSVPYSVIKILHIMLQLLILIGGTCVAIVAHWPLVPTIFYLSEVLIISMKIHSYFWGNRELQLAVENKEPPFGNTTWPENVTYGNFIDFLFVPTVVYEPEYPRTEKIRILYVIEKFFAFAGLWTVLHVVVNTYIIPVLEVLPSISIVQAFCDLAIPMLLSGILIFYIVFDVSCNGFAELTRFADREFYQDWWNSTTFDEYARKWNRPVHMWLLRHVYMEGLSTYKLDKKKATFATFLFSSIIHEYFMSVSLRMTRPWLFILQMSQLPLVAISRTLHLQNTRAGNVVFWCQMLFGLPLLTILYCREYYASIQ